GRAGCCIAGRLDGAGLVTVAAGLLKAARRAVRTLGALSVSDPDREIVVAFVPGDIEDKILPASLSFVQQSSRFSGDCKGLGEFLRRSDLARLLMRPVERHSVHRPLLAAKRGWRSSLRRADRVTLPSAPRGPRAHCRRPPHERVRTCRCMVISSA